LALKGLTGLHQNAMDASKRLRIPAALVKAFAVLNEESGEKSNTVWVMPGNGPFLEMHPYQRGFDIQSALEDRMVDEDKEDEIRDFAALCFDYDLNADSGRIAIPDKTFKCAFPKFEKEEKSIQVAILGRTKYIELWYQDTYDDPNRGEKRIKNDITRLMAEIKSELRAKDKKIREEDEKFREQQKRRIAEKQNEKDEEITEAKVLKEVMFQGLLEKMKEEVIERTPSKKSKPPKD